MSDFGDLAPRELQPIERACTSCGAAVGASCVGQDMHDGRPRREVPYFHAARRHPREA